MTLPWRLEPDRAILEIRAVPGARHERVDGIAMDARDRPHLVVRLRAPAIEGKANAALLAFLAKRLHCPRSRLELAAGATGRLKRVLWHDPPADAAGGSPPCTRRPVDGGA
ncbi:MAG: DUF167 domain-containing protein [Geminicoccaceae bacterium]